MPEIRASPELLAVSRRWFNALISRKDRELQNFLSTSDHLQFIGSAEGETWIGSAVRRAVGNHFREVPNILKREELWANAFESHEVGWAFSAHRFWFENRPKPITFHTTLVYTLEDGSWKIIHRHASIPMPNLETIGYNHSAIQALLDAARQDLSLTQREGLASVMFTDIVDSTVLAAAIGDRAWSALIADHFAQLRGIVESHGGQFVKSLGDGTLSSFPSARAALTAARAIQTGLARQDAEPRLGLRIGLHTGDVVQAEGDFFGTVVNKAARITAQTGAGEICLSDVTRAMVGDSADFTFSAPVATPLRGLDGTHLIHRLGW
ncbi:adenylate/guanylate cyclase domain-containing protein [Sedimentitalea sp. JM2-8]|uniref:Adenylate/guanylate cyclase domain-containing protein n=1 Tax=Sedimentitalea xiamensis TaxID=3050037 RepID=A0ABT7FEW3_9RHOB|nr:nuclear transport factor 2 family protein [Sedimentitalea xiamensis]MDK3073661.1 adenylate/guanylate cyclase domain-containing protein [Sedimentitalea xiamensis]